MVINPTLRPTTSGAQRLANKWTRLSVTPTVAGDPLTTLLIAREHGVVANVPCPSPALR